MRCFAAIALLACGCITTPLPITAQDFRQDPHAFSGKYVRLEGWLYVDPEDPPGESPDLVLDQGLWETPANGLGERLILIPRGRHVRGVDHQRVTVVGKLYAGCIELARWIDAAVERAGSTYVHFLPTGLCAVAYDEAVLFDAVVTAAG